MVEKNTPGRYKKEMIGVLLGALFILTTLSCISYNPNDNTIVHYVSNHTTCTNWCGTLGAHSAALLFYLLGFASYIFLAALGAVVRRPR